ncbi:hypothetical protein [Leptospira johnsonii]|uniref:Uncharacterized protein n=1 Tax=Leptospira johnsonii TaxID=1917820 RepID=A0A2P2D7Z6_9LEPT|nr:hypothetical protein [Leptospira johnsonii]GBF40701.1 hypothetical protein LPTSP1_37190 [Leptospira johnsonii]
MKPKQTKEENAEEVFQEEAPQEEAPQEEGFQEYLRGEAIMTVGFRRQMNKEGETIGWDVLTMMIQEGQVQKMHRLGTGPDWKQAFLLGVKSMGENL